MHPSRTRNSVVTASLLVLSTMFALPASIFAVGDGATKFNVFVPPNDTNAGRRSMMIVTATAPGTTTVDIIDDAADGDSDDTKMGVSLGRGESYIVRLVDGTVNDDVGGKHDGDYFHVNADHPVVVQMATASNWQHDWAASESKSGIGTNFFIYSPATSGLDNDINVFAYSDETEITIRDITSNVITTTGKATANFATSTQVISAKLHEGEDMIVRQNQLGLDILDSGHTYWVQATKPVTIQYGSLGQITGGSQARDGGGFVPSNNGTSAGALYYFTIPHDPGMETEKELRIVCFDDNTTVKLYGTSSNSPTWTQIDSKTLSAGQHADYVGNSNVNFRTLELYKVTVSPAYNKCTVFEANWLETGSYGTSDFASAVAGSNGKSVGQYFVTYMGPPGLESSTPNPTGELTNIVSPTGGYASHLYVYATGSGTTNVTVKDVDTNGTIVNKGFDIPENGYYDMVVDKTAYDAMRASGRRPYLSVRSNKNVSVMNTNFNDNWMAFFYSAIEPEPRASITRNAEQLSCNDVAHVTVKCTNETGPTLSSTTMKLTLPTGIVPVDSSSIPGDPSYSSGVATWNLGSLTAENPASFTFDVKYNCAALSCPTTTLSSLSVECKGSSGAQPYADVVSAQIGLNAQNATNITAFVANDEPDNGGTNPRIHVTFNGAGGVANGTTIVLKRAIDNSDATATQTTLTTFTATTTSTASYSFNDSYPVHYQQNRYYRLFINDGGCTQVVGPIVIATSSGSSGGEDSGLESNGRLATSLARRAIARSVGWASYTPDAMSMTHEVHDDVEAASSALTSTDKSSAHGSEWLQTLFPKAGPHGSAPADVTPFDLPTVTNAKAVASVDYMNDKGDRVASALAVETVGDTYEHGKSLCDRAHGSTLDMIEQTSLEEGDVIRIAVSNDKAHTGEYAIDLKLYQTGDESFTVESKWRRDSYSKPTAGQHVINLQVWSAIPGYEVGLLQQILGQLKIDWNTVGKLPARHFERVGTIGGHVDATIVTEKGIKPDLKMRATRLLENGKQETEEIALDGSSKFTHDFETFADITLELVDSDGNVSDSVWASDGAYAVIDDSLWGGKTKVEERSFACKKSSATSSDDQLSLAGCAKISANVDEVAGVARHLGGEYAPLDLEKYDYVSFYLRSTTAIRVCAESEGAAAKDQACTEVAAQPEGATVALAVSDFKLASCDDAQAKAVDTFTFTSRTKGPTEIEVRSLVLGKGKTDLTKVAGDCKAPEEVPSGLRCSVDHITGSNAGLAAGGMLSMLALFVTRRRSRSNLRSNQVTP